MGLYHYLHISLHLVSWVPYLVLDMTVSVIANLPATDDCVVILDNVHSKLQPFIEQVINNDTWEILKCSKEVSSVIHIFVPAGAYRQTEDLRPAGQDQQVLPPPHHLPSRDIVKKRIMHSPHQLRP